MSYGPIFPFDDYLAAAAGNVGSGFYAGGGGNAAAHFGGYQVVASLGANSTIELRFAAPTSVLPSGTPYLRYWAVSNANGNAKFTASVGRAARGASLSAATLSALAQQTVGWSSQNDDVISGDVSLATVLSALTADDLIDVAVKFQTGGWTLTAISTWQFAIVWY